LIQALVVQNANAYNEGLGDALRPLVAYVQNQNVETEKGARSFLSFDAIKWLYTDGADNISKISPDGYSIDHYYLSRPGNDEIQLALFRNYGTNLSLYDEWHSYFRKYQPAVLIISGKNDKLFLAAGAEGFKKRHKRRTNKSIERGPFCFRRKALGSCLINQIISVQARNWRI
jgi:hypothetical protein